MNTSRLWGQYALTVGIPEKTRKLGAKNLCQKKLDTQQQLNLSDQWYKSFDIYPFLLLAHFNISFPYSWTLKWAFLIVYHPSSVCSSLCKLFTFSSSPQQPLIQFQPNLAQSIPGWRRLKFLQMKGHTFPKREIILEIHWWLLKIFLSRTTGPISTKIGTKVTWGIKIQIYSS